MIYACPKCGVQYEIDQPGEYQCSQCNQEFIIDPEPQPQPMKIAQPVQTVQPAKTTEQKQHTIICPFCKSELPADVKKCSHCGEWLSQADKPKSNAVYLLLSFFFGTFGVAEFYAGRTVYGFCIPLVAFGGCLVVGIITRGALTLGWIGLITVLQFIVALSMGVPLPEHEQKMLAAQAAIEREKRRLTGKGKILVAILLLAYIVCAVVFEIHVKNAPIPDEEITGRMGSSGEGDFIVYGILLAVFFIPAWLFFAWIARKVFPRKQLETSSVSLSEIAYNQEVGQESGVQALRRKFAEESMQNGPAGFAKYNGKWINLNRNREKLSLLAYVLLGLIGITSAFGVHLFYAKCNKSGAVMIFLSVLGMPFAWALGAVIHPAIAIVFCLLYILYWLCTLVYGWDAIKEYNGD